jgi:hypothetical protein
MFQLKRYSEAHRNNRKLTDHWLSILQGICYQNLDEQKFTIKKESQSSAR